MLLPELCNFRYLCLPRRHHVLHAGIWLSTACTRWPTPSRPSPRCGLPRGMPRGPPREGPAGVLAWRRLRACHITQLFPLCMCVCLDLGYFGGRCLGRCFGRVGASVG